MNIRNVSRWLFATALLTFAMTANAAFIDFTDDSWSDAINIGSNTNATIDNVTLTALNGKLTFNARDRGGCVAGQPTNGLTCDGDGIGVNNDEITQAGSEFTSSDQTITISFAEAVDITNLYVLDLFGSEGNGEIAVIDGVGYQAPAGNLGIAGGYYATGFTGFGITSIVLTGNEDYFSDYALAAIDVEISAVPLPGALILFGSALLGMFGFKRFS